MIAIQKIQNKWQTSMILRKKRMKTINHDGIRSQRSIIKTLH